MTNVIAAISTPPGKGGVAVIRMSGDGAFEIAKKVFFPRSGKDILSYPKRVQIYGEIIEDGEVIDDVLLTLFNAPASYTGEDTVEISCHGGILVTKAVLEALLRNGAAAASAGEFTKRAFINGRLSLTEAEAIGSLLDAKSKSELKLHASVSRDRLSEKISEIREYITDTLSSIYARIDYPDEDLGEFNNEDVRERLYIIKERIEALLSTYKTGKAVSEGIKAVICGKPNVGKSSLYNLLLGEDAAIVTDIEGTTRDVLEKCVSVGDVTLRLIDTAGIRDNEELDAVERIGIEKSHKMIKECELLFAMFDLSRHFDEKDQAVLDEAKNLDCAKIAILNKADQSELFAKSSIGGIFDEVITVSTLKGDEEAIQKISAVVKKLFIDERISVGSDAIIFSARQNASLTRALDFIKLSVSAIEAGFEQDAVSGDIERALGAISELDGRSVSEEITKDIFSKFCVGK